MRFSWFRNVVFDGDDLDRNSFLGVDKQSAIILMVSIISIPLEEVVV